MQTVSDKVLEDTLGSDRGRAPFPSRMSVWASRLIGVVVLSLAFVLWSVVQFGSPSVAISYFRGERLVVDQPTLSVEEGKAGDVRNVEFTVRNIGRSPIRVVGANTSCTCVVFSDLPLTVPGRGFHVLKLAAKYRAQGDLLQAVTYYSDCPTQPELPIEIRGKLIK
jgi:hypothetical protein